MFVFFFLLFKLIGFWDNFFKSSKNFLDELFFANLKAIEISLIVTGRCACCPDHHWLSHFFECLDKFFLPIKRPIDIPIDFFLCFIFALNIYFSLELWFKVTFSSATIRFCLLYTFSFSFPGFRLTLFFTNCF